MAKNKTIGDYDTLSGDFLSGLGESIPKEPTPQEGKTGRKTTPHRNPSSLIAKTYKIPKDLIEKVERIAYWRRVRIQEVVAAALREYVERADDSELKTKEVKR